VLGPKATHHLVEFGDIKVAAVGRPATPVALAALPLKGLPG
jgi:hypothetical protein